MNTTNTMRSTQFRSKSGWHYALIGLTAFAAQGLLLLNDGLYWDGWLIHRFLDARDWPNLSKIFVESGLPIWTYLHRLMGYSPDIVLGYRLAAFACIAASGLLIYQIGCLSGLVSPEESLLIALISLTYPGFQVAFELIILPYVLGYFLFWLAVFLALLAEQQDKPARYGLRVGALLGFGISFGINSLLVFYFGFLWLLVLFVRRSRSLSVREIFTSFLPRHLDYLLLPFLYWISKEILFPRQGLYGDYNQFRLSPGSLAVSVGKFLYNSIYYQVNSALTELTRQPMIGLIVFLAAYWCYNVLGVRSSGLPGDRVKLHALPVFGCILLGLGILPYVAVGLGPTAHGWSTRHALLVALPLAIVIVGLVRLVFATGDGMLSRTGWVLVVVLVGAFSLSTVHNYISWQARWVKDRSIMVNLAASPEFKPFSVYWVDDQFPAGGEPFYRFYEWSSMFRTVWGDESRIGLDKRFSGAGFLSESGLFFTSRYNLADFDPLGCQAALTIQRAAPRYSDIELAMRYLFHRFLRPSGMNTFLASVTDLTVSPVDASEALHCVY